MNAHPTVSLSEELSSPESYPTFWDAIPVDTPGDGPHRAASTALSGTLPQDAYAAFLTLAEEGLTSTLQVEQTDVG